MSRATYHPVGWRIALMMSITAAIIFSGCHREEYGQKDLTLDSPQAQQIRQMLADLNQSQGEQTQKLLDVQVPDDLSPEVRQAMGKMILSLARNPDAALVAIDQFGNDIFRATFSLGSAADSKKITFLLVQSDKQLFWAKTN